MKIGCNNILASHLLALFLILGRGQEYGWQEYVDHRGQDTT
jgi:hypothetical protein